MCSADGSILPPIIIIPRKTPLRDFAPPANVIVYYKNGSKTFDSDVITNGVIRRVLLPHVLRNGQTKPLLFIDHAPCHTTEQVQDECNENNITLVKIPRRMTSLLQPIDVSVIRAFKSRYHDLWRDWYLNSDKSFTTSGNMRSPPYSTVINIII
jgi:hypothetical protein